MAHSRQPFSRTTIVAGASQSAGVAIKITVVLKWRKVSMIERWETEK
jgi:hypothetical protein